MHLQYNQQINNNSNPISPTFGKSVDCELNRVATELNLLARTFLRDGVLGGILVCLEDDIRQDAILLALKWFMKGNFSPAAEGECPPMPWHSARAMAAALKFTKLRYSKRLHKEAERKAGVDQDCDEGCPHYFDLKPNEWPEATVRELIRQAIHSVVRSGRVSQTNGCIALLVFHDGESVIQIAKRRGVHRTAINQRLVRVRRELKSIVGTIEMPIR